MRKFGVEESIFFQLLVLLLALLLALPLAFFLFLSFLAPEWDNKRVNFKTCELNKFPSNCVNRAFLFYHNISFIRFKL